MIDFSGGARLAAGAGPCCPLHVRHRYPDVPLLVKPVVVADIPAVLDDVLDDAIRRRAGASMGE
jgi:hypothetical protein